MKKRTKPYVYVSLTAEDFPRVGKYIRSLESSGFKVKYDYSMRAWNSHNAQNIENCSAFIVFFSKKSSEDPKVTSEINYASTHDIPVISVHIDTLTITSGMSRIFDNGYSILAYNLHSIETEAEIVKTVKNVLGKAEVFPIKTAVILASVISLAIIFTASILITSSKNSENNVETTSNIVQNQVQGVPDSNNDVVVESAADITTPEIVTITVETPFIFDDPSEGAYVGILESFNKRYRDKSVEFKNVTATTSGNNSQNYYNYSNYLMNEIESGIVPDVFVLDYSLLNNMTVAQRGLIVDVQTIRSVYEDYGSNIYDGAIECVRDPLTKNCYALPVRGYWEGLFCNQELFQYYGVDMPNDWDKMTAAIETFNQNGITPISASIGVVPNYLTDHLILSYAGEDEFNKTPTGYSEVPQSWVTGINFFKELFDKKAFPENTDSLLDAETTDLFLQKKAAMKIDGSWLCSSISETDSDITVISFPTVPGGAKTPEQVIGAYSSGWAISKAAWDNPKKRQLCVDLINEMTSKENLGSFTLISGAPAGKVENISGKIGPNVIDAGVKMVESAVVGGKGFSSSLRNRYENINKFYDCMYGVMTGEVPAEESFNALFSATVN